MKAAIQLFTIILIVCCCVQAQDKPKETPKQRAIRDGYASRAVFGDGVYAGFNRFVKYSSIIAVGTLVQRGTRLSADEDFVITDYDFTLVTILKGNVGTDTPLHVARGGGKFKIGSAVAEVVAGKPITNDNYVLFLEPCSEAGVYCVSAGELGSSFRIVGGKMKCESNVIERKLCDIPLADFESQVQQTVAAIR